VARGGTRRDPRHVDDAARVTKHAFALASVALGCFSGCTSRSGRPAHATTDAEARAALGACPSGYHVDSRIDGEALYTWCARPDGVADGSFVGLRRTDDSAPWKLYGTFRNGRPEGEWRWVGSSGRSVQHYVNGELDGICEMSSDHLRWRLGFRGGVAVGPLETTFDYECTRMCSGTSPPSASEESCKHASVSAVVVDGRLDGWVIVNGTNALRYESGKLVESTMTVEPWLRDALDLTCRGPGPPLGR
jgi:hypothetical protein